VATASAFAWARSLIASASPSASNTLKGIEVECGGQVWVGVATHVSINVVNSECCRRWVCCLMAWVRCHVTMGACFHLWVGGGVWHPTSSARHVFLCRML
jgi:hypothetical protein